MRAEGRCDAVNAACDLSIEAPAGMQAPVTNGARGAFRLFRTVSFKEESPLFFVYSVYHIAYSKIHISYELNAGIQSTIGPDGYLPS